MKDLEKMVSDRQREDEKNRVSDTPNRRIRATLVFDILCAQCQNADLSSDIRTRPIWSSTKSEVDLITKNSQVDWQ